MFYNVWFRFRLWIQNSLDYVYHLVYSLDVHSHLSWHPGWVLLSNCHLMQFWPWPWPFKKEEYMMKMRSQHAWCTVMHRMQFVAVLSAHEVLDAYTGSDCNVLRVYTIIAYTVYRLCHTCHAWYQGWFERVHVFFPTWKQRHDLKVEQLDPETMSNNFRLWLTSMPAKSFPVQVGTKNNRGYLMYSIQTREWQRNEHKG